MHGDALPPQKAFRPRPVFVVKIFCSSRAHNLAKAEGPHASNLVSTVGILIFDCQRGIEPISCQGSSVAASMAAEEL
jgi:hypothetical protein